MNPIIAASRSDIWTSWLRIVYATLELCSSTVTSATWWLRRVYTLHWNCTAPRWLLQHGDYVESIRYTGTVQLHGGVLQHRDFVESTLHWNCAAPRWRLATLWLRRVYTRHWKCAAPQWRLATSWLRRVYATLELCSSTVTSATSWLRRVYATLELCSSTVTSCNVVIT